MPRRPLKLVPPSAISSEPPLTLGEAVTSLWKRLLSEHEAGDAGVREALALICQAADRVEALRTQINRDGELVDGRLMESIIVAIFSLLRKARRAQHRVIALG
jgi:hypothetical protein